MSLLRRCLPLLSLLLSVVVVSASEPVTFRQVVMNIDGLQRSYYLYVPENLSQDTNVPLMVVLPPYAFSGQSMAILTGMNDAADQYGFIALYPENPNYWDDGRYTAGLPPFDMPNDDLTFIQNLLDTLVTQLPIDQDQVFVAGYRDSGGMAFRLACKMPDRFDGVVVVGALMWVYERNECAQATTSINLMLLHSSDDTVYLPQGQVYRPYLDYDSTFRILGVDETLLYWIEHNGCNPSGTIVYARNRVTLNSTCNDGKTIAYYNMRGAGDTWARLGNNRINRVGIDATQIMVRFLLKDEAWMDATVPGESIVNVSRNYIFYVPSSYDPSVPMPLVVLLHMRDSDGSDAAYITDMNRVAEENGFIVIYPNAINGFWNFGRSFPEYEIMDGTDDVQFIVSLVENLSYDLNIDQNRVYVGGISNGGFMTLRTACDASDTFAAFAIVGASQFRGLSDVCQGKPPIPMMHIHGTADDDIFWDGLQETYNGQLYWRWRPVPESIDFWVNHNNCQLEAQYSTLPPSGQSPETTVDVIHYQNCAEQSEVILYQINNGGHNWPGVDRLPENQAGNVNMDFHAGEVMWEFFSNHTLNE